MPDSPPDDPFAELFGKLPDPRSRELNGRPSTTSASDSPETRAQSDAASADAGSRSAPADGSADERPSRHHSDAPAQDPVPPADGAPLSRRAAREASRRTPASTPDRREPVSGDSDPAAGSREPAAPADRVSAERPRAGASAPSAATSARSGDAADAPPTPVSASSAHGIGAASTTTSASAPAGDGPPSGRGRRSAVEERSTVDDRSAVEKRSAVGDPDAVDGPGAVAEPGADRRAPRTSSPGLEDLFAGNTTTDDLGSTPPPRDKRRRRIGGWIALGVVLVILGGIAGGGWYVWSTYEDRIRAFMGWEEPKDFEPGLANGEAFLTIVSGDTGASISPKLHEAGVTKTADAFYDYLVEENLNPPFVPGVFALQQQMTSAAALEAIMNPENKMENTAQLREGLTVAQSLPLLAEGTGLPLEDFQAAVADPTVYGITPDPAVVAAGGQPLEGWLFPATYTFDPGVTAQDVIQRLVDRTIQSLDAAGVPPEDRQRVLTIASIIQREARFEADMQKVSTVIQNRLDTANQETFGLLQMDSTAQYGFGELQDGTVSSSGEALDDDNPWNTYVNTGLPVGPIANPGDVAIDAAMHPVEGDWLYFVTVNLNTGETVFTTNIDDHNRAVEQWQSWCRDNPDAGC